MDIYDEARYRFHADRQPESILKLPLILDSPSGKELDQYNIQKLMDIIDRDFSENQVIIASIYHYKLDNLTTIEMGRRVVC